MSEMIAVGQVADFNENSLNRIVIEGHVLAVYNIDGAFYATDGICTHMDFDLAAEGELMGDVVECPAHFGQFHVPTGAPRARPCLVPLKTYPVKVEDGAVFVAFDKVKA